MHTTTNNSWSFNLSWQLSKSCFNFMLTNTVLFLFPILSFLISLIVIALGTAFLIALYYPHLAAIEAAPQNQSWTSLSTTVLILYFLLNFTALFFNSALLACIIKRFRQEPCTLGQGISLAANRIVNIFIWSLINASIGSVLNFLQKIRGVGRLIALILGASWSLMSYFALPFIIMDNLNPIAALHQSYQTFKGNWRKMFSVFGLLVASVMLIFAILLGLAYCLQGTGYLFVAIIGLFILALVVVGIISSMLETVLKGALYVDIIKHGESSGISKELLAKAIQQQ